MAAAWVIQSKDIPLQRKGMYPCVKAIPAPRVLTILVKLQNSSDLSKLCGMQEDLALDMGIKNCRITRSYGNVVIEIPFPADLCTILPAKSLKRKDGLWLTLGKTSQMQPIQVKLDGPEIAPIIVTGRTGAGKTEALKLMLWELALQNIPQDLGIVVFDPKNKFQAVSHLPHLRCPILRTDEDGMRAVCWLAEELDRRMRHEYSTPKIVVFVDELINLLQMDNSGIISEKIGSIARLGREMGIHLIIATQRPSRKYLDAVVAANIGLRLVGHTPDTTEATTAAGRGGSNAHKLTGRGDVVAILGASMKRIQIAMVDDTDLENLPRAEAPTPLLGYNLDVEEDSPRRIPFTPRELAVALTDAGIIKLREQLHIGQPRATELRHDWAEPILEELGRSGYRVILEESKEERDDAEGGTA